MIPTKSPGTLFSSFIGDDPTLNIRFYVAADPVFYETLNRPLADIAVRQLVMAKSIDTIQLGMGYSILYPYLIQPRIISGTQQHDIPIRMIWDMSASLPKKWENLRLAKIKRMSGLNGTTDGYSGVLRLIFTANVINSLTEVAIFYADYEIHSNLTYQPQRLNVVTSDEESVAINPGESETVAGFLIFRTLDLDLEETMNFLNILDPPSDTTIGSDGFYINPTEYEVANSISGGPTIINDFSIFSMSHGTGLLTDSAWSSIPQLDSDTQSWLISFNYPFDANANRVSGDNITIPGGLFKEFSITAPAGDRPSDDNSGLTYPVWLSRIEKTDTNQLRFYFATYNITDNSPSTVAIEFATLDLSRTMVHNEIVDIIPASNLLLQDGSEFGQHFGRGHVVLSSLWEHITNDVNNFFDAFDLIPVTPADTEFSISSTRISSFGVSRVPKYIPTIGQSHALRGSTSRRTTQISPSNDNRYVTELDQGLGNQVDLESRPGITPHSAIDRYGHAGSLNHRIVRLVVDATAVGDSPTFYNDHVLPRLRALLGRDPQFGDFWFNGTRLLFMNGDSWQG